MLFIQRVQSFISSPIKVAIALAVLLVFWLFVIGDYKSANSDAPSSDTSNTNSELMSVEVSTSNASETSRSIVVNGQLRPWRNVTIKAEVAGRVENVVKDQGDQVNTGDTLLKLSDEGRTEQLAEAQANLKYRQLELDSAKKLTSSKLVSAAELSRLQSEQTKAQANLKNAQLAFEKSAPSAPFKGIVNRRHIETGDQVSAGDSLVDIVQIETLKASAQVPQQTISQVVVGQSLTLHLIDGSELSGTLTFISSVADEETRSYYIEIEVANPDLKRIAGASVTAHIPIKTANTHSLSPSLLSLDGSGKLGIYTVNNDDVVEYYPIEIVSIDKQAIVSGLPDQVRIITVGAGFVQAGDKVKAVELPQ